MKITPVQLYDSTLIPVIENMNMTPKTEINIDSFFKFFACSFKISDAKITVKIGMVACKIPASDEVMYNKPNI